MFVMLTLSNVRLSSLGDSVQHTQQQLAAARDATAAARAALARCEVEEEAAERATQAAQLEFEVEQQELATKAAQLPPSPPLPPGPPSSV